MKNKIVSDFGKSFKRLNKTKARKEFELGKEILVMSIDRNPVNSLSSPYIYYKGCRPIMGMFIEMEYVNTFDDLLEDFSTWLNCDGYGHMPQKYYARNYMFSYWVRLE